ncbi:hypothetical protein Q3G72_005142 [Acer saccharum]|nr:hypothetical protein Q3G72_005142 [Acer saccharum]
MYKQQVKALFKNLSKAHNEASRIYGYIIEGRLSYLTMCDCAYLKKLAFQYLEDLKIEFEHVNGAQIETAARPYAFIKFALVLTSSLNTIVCGGQLNVQSNESPVYAEKAKDLNRQALIRKWAPVAIVFEVVFVLFWLK